MVNSHSNNVPFVMIFVLREENRFPVLSSDEVSELRFTEP